MLPCLDIHIWGVCATSVESIARIHVEPFVPNRSDILELITPEGSKVISPQYVFLPKLITHCGINLPAVRDPILAKHAVVHKLARVGPGFINRIAAKTASHASLNFWFQTAQMAIKSYSIILVTYHNIS